MNKGFRKNIDDRNYTFNENHIVKQVKSGELKILEKTLTNHSKDYKKKAYIYQCNICGNIDQVSETHH